MRTTIKTLLALLALLLCSSSYAQIINFLDSNFKAKLLQASTTSTIARDSLDNKIKIDINGDNEIQQSEALRVYRLSVSNDYNSNFYKINDLTGIAYFKKLDNLDCAGNLLSSLDLSGLDSLKSLSCSNNQLSSLVVNGLTNLFYLNCSSNHLININLEGLNNLKRLICFNNLLNNLNLGGLNNLTSLTCYNNQLSNLNLTNLNNLKYLHCALNKISNLNFNNLNNLDTLFCYSNELTTLNFNGLKNLKVINCDSNKFTTINPSGLSNLKYFSCSSNLLNTITLDALVNLNILYCADNFLSNIDIRGLSNLKKFNCNNNLLTTFNLAGLDKLEIIKCEFNKLSSINLSGLTNLQELFCSYNQLTVMSFNGLNSLNTIECLYNQLTSLNLVELKELRNLSCSFNQLTTLNLNGLTNMFQLFCAHNNLTTLNLNDVFDGLFYLSCSNNQLQSIYIKNGKKDLYIIPNMSFFIDNNPNLKFICADDIDFNAMKTVLDYYGYNNVTIGSFCGGTSGGSYYTLSGNVRYDAANNGCTTQDSIFPYLKMKLENGDASGYIISDASGVYSLSLPADTFNITPVFENPYFTISPTSTTIIMPDTIFPNFCITPNGIHHDVSVSIIPIRSARPGLSDAIYKIVYTNKGTSTQSGAITFQYDETLSDFVTSNPSPNNISAGVLSFNYSNLKIFESRSIIVTMRTNSPADMPPVNAGDVLKFSSSITGSITDETPEDNIFNLMQTVLGSFDPNDKTCLQGNIITPGIIGEYVDYLIRFENTGTAAAENVVITDYIDLSKFDISTLALTSTSHSCRTAISEGNKVQFIFDKIMLPFTEPEKHGYVAFKIKTLSSLAVGDTLSNKADIYFDYNLPVATNTAMSLILTLTPVKQNNYNIRLQLLPNPSDGNFVLRLEGKGSLVGQLKIYDLTGTEVYMQIIVHSDISSHTIHADLPAGMYYLQLQSDGNSWTEKLVIGK